MANKSEVKEICLKSFKNVRRKQQAQIGKRSALRIELN